MENWLALRASFDAQRQWRLSLRLDCQYLHFVCYLHLIEVYLHEVVEAEVHGVKAYF